MSHWLHDKQKQEKWANFVQTLNPDLDAHTLRLMDEFQVLSRTIYHLNEQSVTIPGLSFAQYRVLLHLFFAEQMDDCGELNPSEISNRQGVSRNTMRSFIRNLEEEGFVERRLDPHDRRRFNISLTDTGRALVSEHARHHLETIGQCFRVLTTEEQEMLHQLLTKVRERATAVRQ